MDHWNFKKRTFSKKGPVLEKAWNYKMPMRLSIKRALHGVWGVSKFPEQKLKNVSKSDSETYSEKQRDLVFVLGRKGSEKCSSDAPGGSLS